MTHTIAIAGKGGVGKTTISGMIVDYLCRSKKTPILVVDADANSNLNEVLGVEVDTTLGDIREEMAQAEKRGDTIPGGMTKADYAEFRFGSALIEEDDFDMLVMGRTQGKGCYCFVNGILQTQLEKYAGKDVKPPNGEMPGKTAARRPECGWCLKRNSKAVIWRRAEKMG